MKDIVSVIIPSYNRAHLLKEVLPSYFQDEVKEVIVINDASKDNTIEVLKQLQSEYPKLIVINNEENIKQTGSKNKGLDICTGEYVLFGDDDCVLFPNSIKCLLETLSDKNCDVVGTRVLYMSNHDTTPESCKDRYDIEGLFVCDYVNLEFEYTEKLDTPVRCDYSHAQFLATRKAALSNRFDTNYVGNAYREETDYLLGLYSQGFISYFDSRAVVVNLRQATGGARTGTKFNYYYCMFKNNYYFLKKNNKTINKLTNTNGNLYIRQAVFIVEKALSFSGRIVKKLTGR